MMKASRSILINLRSIMILIAVALFVCGPASAAVISPTNITFGQPTASFTVVSGHNAITPYGSSVVGAQTDDSSAEVTINDTIEDGININGVYYNSIYVGSNGYITFGHPQTSFSAVGIPGYTVGPMIAGQFDDIKPPNGGTVYCYEDDDNDTVSITWKDVAPYTGPMNGSGNNTFQILLHGLGNGDFGIEIRYENISWIQGSSGGAFPTGGWTFGDQLTYGEVNDSGTVEFLTIEDESNIGHPGVFAWEVHDGGVEEIDLNISENSPGGTVVGPLTADDDTPLELNFTLLDDDGGNFEIFNDSGVYKVRVKSGATLDYETSPNHIRQINVQAKDPDTNTGSAWLNISLMDVNEAPAVPGAFISPTSGQIIKGAESMTVRWGSSTDPDGDTLKYDLWYFNGTWAQIGNLLSSNSTAYTLPADDTSSAMFRVYANDTALNSSAKDITFAVDSSPPVVTIITPANSSTINDPTPALSATFGGETVIYAWYNLDNTGNSTRVFNTVTLNVALTSLSDGVHNITVYANDSLGHLNSSIVYFTVDTTEPAVSPDDSSGPVNLPTPLPENVVNNEVKGTIFSEPVSSADLKFNKGYITLVTVDAKGTISEVMVTIQKLVGKPSEIKVAPPSGAVHTYHNIELGRIGNSDLEGATIKFKAEKKWIAENGGDRNKVVIMRYHDTWMALETKPISEDDEYVFFSARTPGFSTFAITMELEKKEVVPVEVQTPEPVIEEVVDEVVPEPKEETSYWWLIFLIIAIVGVVFFVYKNKKDESEE